MTSFKRPVTRRFKQPTQSKFQKDTVNSFSRYVINKLQEEKRGKCIKSTCNINIDWESFKTKPLPKYKGLKSPKKELQDDDSEIYDVNYGCNIPYYKPGNKVKRYRHY